MGVGAWGGGWPAVEAISTTGAFIGATYLLWLGVKDRREQGAARIRDQASRTFVAVQPGRTPTQAGLLRYSDLLRRGAVFEEWGVPSGSDALLVPWRYSVRIVNHSDLPVPDVLAWTNTLKPEGVTRLLQLTEESHIPVLLAGEHTVEVFVTTGGGRWAELRSWNRASRSPTLPVEGGVANFITPSWILVRL